MFGRSIASTAVGASRRFLSHHRRPLVHLRTASSFSSLERSEVQDFLQQTMSLVAEKHIEESTKNKEALERTRQLVQNQFSEASRCIQDCYDDPANLSEEVATADKALERAVASLVDWLDEVRSSGNEECDVQQREEFVSQIKHLRKRLDGLQPK